MCVRRRFRFLCGWSTPGGAGAGPDKVARAIEFAAVFATENCRAIRNDCFSGTLRPCNSCSPGDLRPILTGADCIRENLAFRRHNKVSRAKNEVFPTERN